MAHSTTSIIRWGMASRARKGEADSGDRHLLVEYPGSLLMAVVDGAGHGPEAAAAAEHAIRSLDKAPPGAGLVDLVNNCHEQMRGTRGGVISMGLIKAQDNSLNWLGVGNVEGAVFGPGRGKPARLLLRNGVIGRWLPVLKPATLALAPGDTVVFATDGVDNRFTGELEPGGADPQALADRIVRDYGLQSDDALALVVRYTGSHS